MCTLYHQGKTQTQSESSTSSSQSNSVNQSASFSDPSMKITTSEINFKAKKKDLSPGSETVLGQVWVGSPHEAICIPANSVKVMKGKTSKIAQ